MLRSYAKYTCYNKTCSKKFFKFTSIKLVLEKLSYYRKVEKTVKQFVLTADLSVRKIYKQV